MEESDNEEAAKRNDKHKGRFFCLCLILFLFRDGGANSVLLTQGLLNKVDTQRGKN